MSKLIFLDETDGALDLLQIYNLNGKTNMAVLYNTQGLVFLWFVLFKHEQHAAGLDVKAIRGYQVGTSLHGCFVEVILKHFQQLQG